MDDPAVTPTAPPAFSSRAVKQYKRIIGGRWYLVFRILTIVFAVLLVPSLVSLKLTHGATAWLIPTSVTAALTVSCGWLWFEFWHPRRLGEFSDLPDGMSGEVRRMDLRYDRYYRTQHHRKYWLLYARTTGIQGPCILAWNGTKTVDIELYVAAQLGYGSIRARRDRLRRAYGRQPLHRSGRR